MLSKIFEWREKVLQMKEKEIAISPKSFYF